MPLSLIYSGSKPNDGTGDFLRDSCIKINSNFEFLSQSVLDNSFPYTGSAQITGSLTITGSLKPSQGLLVPNVEANKVIIGNIISSSRFLSGSTYTVGGTQKDPIYRVQSLHAAKNTNTSIRWNSIGSEPIKSVFFTVNNKKLVNLSTTAITHINPNGHDFVFQIGGIQNPEYTALKVKCGLTSDHQYVTMGYVPENVTSFSDYLECKLFLKRPLFTSTMKLTDLPTSDPGIKGKFYTQTSDQLSGVTSGLGLVILCVSEG